MPNTVEKKLLSIREVAESLGLCERSVFAATHPRGRLIAVKIGRRIAYRPQDVEEFLKNCRQA